MTSSKKRIYKVKMECGHFQDIRSGGFEEANGRAHCNYCGFQVGIESLIKYEIFFGPDAWIK